MKNLIKAISKLPIYTDAQWQAIIKLQNKIDATTRNSKTLMIQQNARIAEMRSRNIYIPLVVAGESAVEALKAFSDLIKLLNETGVQLQLNAGVDAKKTKLFNGDDMPILYEGLIGDSLSRDELLDLQKRIQSLDIFAANLAAYPGTDIGFSSASEAQCYLLPLYTSLATKIAEHPDSPKNGKVIAPVAKNAVIEETLRLLHNEPQSVSHNQSAASIKLIEEKNNNDARIKTQLDLALLSKDDAVGVCYLLNKEFDKYKLILLNHIKSELQKKHNDVCLEYFNRAHLTNAQIDPIVEMFHDMSPTITNRKVVTSGVAPTANTIATHPMKEFQVSDTAKVKLNRLIIDNPNLGRVIANYRIVYDAQTKLNHVSNNGLPVAADRLNTLLSSYPHLQTNLKSVGNTTVDNATRGFFNIFKWIWTNLKWRNSTMRQQEDAFSNETNRLSSLARILVDRSKRATAAPKPNEPENEVAIRKPRTSMRTH